MTRDMLGKIAIGTFVVIGGLTVLVIGIGLVSTTRSAASGTKYDWSAYEVKVEGDRTSWNGVEPTVMEFKGGCLVSNTDGSNESKSISGSTPQSFSYVGRGISCNYQKQRGDSDKLKVTVRRDGQIVKTLDTSAEYGIVSFAI